YAHIQLSSLPPEKAFSCGTARAVRWPRGNKGQFSSGQSKSLSGSEDPRAAQRSGQRYGVQIFPQFPDRKPEQLAARQQDLRVAALERVAGQRGRSGRIAQQFGPAFPLADENVAARRRQVQVGAR